MVWPSLECITGQTRRLTPAWPLKITVMRSALYAQLLTAIGAGGMGEVYKTRDPRAGSHRWYRNLAGEILRKLRARKRAVPALDHPHICTLYDVGTDYLVMEYIEGAPIKGPLPLDRALKYAVQSHTTEGITHAGARWQQAFLPFHGRQIMAVAVKPGPEANLEPPTALFRLPVSHSSLAPSLRLYEVSPDGQKFFVAIPNA